MSICKDVHYYFWFPHAGTWLSEHMHNYYPNFREQYRHPHQKRLLKEELPMMKTLEEQKRRTYFQRMSRDSGLLGLSVLHSGTPLRPKAAKVEPHTHSKRYAGNFLWSWASGMARGRVRRTYIRTSHFMTFLHEAIFAGRAETKEKRRR